MPSERPDGDQIEHFLVDGVAPAVIGGGPPESPFELEPDPEPEPRHRAAPLQAFGQTPRDSGALPRPSSSSPRDSGASPGGMPYGQPGPHYEDHGYHREPPTAPIPVIKLPAEPEKRKSWMSRVFRLPGQ